MEEAAVVATPTVDYRGFITPHHPRTDENSAMAVYEYREMERLGLDQPPAFNVKFFGKPDCSLAELDQFLTDGYLPIEIGEMRYQAVGAGSAAEAMVQMIGFSLSDLTEGEQKLLEMLVRRNHSGYMNQFHMSIPRILKDVYHLSGYAEVEVMNRFKDIVHAFLEYENRPEGETAVTIPSELNDLAKMTKDCQLAAFTPGRYLRDLCYRGEPADQIREKVKFWVTAWNRFQSELDRARTEWPKAEKLRFSFNGLPAAALVTDNRFFSKVCFSDRQAGNVDLLVTMNPAGHTAVMIRGKKNTATLFRELEMREPGIWHRHGATGNILNGGLEFPDVAPTGLKLSELAGLVAQFPPR